MYGSQMKRRSFFGLVAGSASVTLSTHPSAPRIGQKNDVLGDEHVKKVLQGYYRDYLHLRQRQNLTSGSNKIPV